MKVCAGTITSSPGPMPAASSETVSAAVPDATPTQCSDSAELRELALEGLYLAPEHEPPVLEHAFEGPAQLVGERQMIAAEVHEGDRRDKRLEGARGHAPLPANARSPASPAFPSCP